MKALVIGATGATGQKLTELLLDDPDFTEVHVFVRRNLTQHHEKLRIHVVDFNQPESWQDKLVGDVAFSSLGTTLKDAGSTEAQRRIDFDYQYNFAKTAQTNHVSTFILVSSYNADAESRFFYSKIKGELENAVKDLRFERLTIFRPGLLVRPASTRFFENVAVKLLKGLNTIGLLKSQTPLPVEILATAMLKASKIKSAGNAEINLKNIFSFARS